MFVPSVTHPIGDFVREWVPRLAEYLPANIQSEDLNSVVAFLINAVICIIAVCVVNIGSAPILIYMERKVCAHVQCRLGPMRLGWHGTLQTIAPEIRALTVQTVVYYLLASLLARIESRYGERIKALGLL